MFFLILCARRVKIYINKLINYIKKTFLFQMLASNFNGVKKVKVALQARDNLSGKSWIAE